MLKYVNTGIVFQEIPDETTLAINISNCPCHCPGCHSHYLWEDVGIPLDTNAIDQFVDQYGTDITCISFMGGDADPKSVNQLAQYIHEYYPQFRVAWYSGRIRIPSVVCKADFDYIKVGPYIKHLGPLKSPTTNQRLYRQQTDGSFEDITYRFWRKPSARLAIWLTFLLLATGIGQTWAVEQLPAKLQSLTDEAYRCYSARETDNFFEAVKRVKDATEFSNYQETYYRACSYEAIYMFEYVDRKKGVELSHAIYNHAKEDNNNIGMYFATFTLGSIREMSGNNDLAEKSLHQALELKEKYLPEESAAPCYLGLCEIALRKKNYDEVQVNARKALDEPGAIPMNQITAWSYKCLIRYNQGDSLGFEEAYKERAQLIAEHGGQGGLFGELINVYQAKNRKQWQLALKRTDKLIHQQNKCAQKASIYEHMGDLKQALYWQKKTREVIDSIQSSEARAQMNEFDAELTLTYAENDAKEQQLAKERLMLIAGAVIAALVIAFLAFIAIRRKKHMTHLQSVHNQLQQAYDQLEKTTAAKERIESELRIAREIQKRMLPHVFPKRRDVDIYAMMTPAKEVGGDLYAYALIDDLLYFCVGDVSGKGVPAALFMAEVTRMFRTLVDGKLTPDTIANRLNHALAEDNEQGMFVTMFIGLIHLQTGHMEFCNAGHNPPLLNGEYMKMESNAPIGLWSEMEFEGEEVDDMHGKTLFVYTDGINEAENINKEQFGDDRLQALLKEDLGSARRTSEAVHKAVEEFVGDAEPSDDLTKMCIKMK